MPFTVLLADALGPPGLEVLAKEHDITLVDRRMSHEELVAEIGRFDAVIVRSATTITADIIEAGTKLRAIGRAGVGVDNIDVAAATKRGIIVFNAPAGNTLSTAEHAVSMLMALARSIPQAVQSMREGKWEKKLFNGAELYDKTLGVMGLGRIGSSVARRMQAFGMRVIGYDPVVTPERAKALDVELVDLPTLLRQSDFITIHTPLTPDTENCINAEALAMMKPSARLVNCARGGIVDEEALYDALKNKQIAGAAFDVFREEPPRQSRLLELANFIATPHIGAATAEAQDKVAIEVAEQLINALRGRPVATAVNVPSIDPVLFQELQPFIDLTERLGRFLAQYMEGHAREISVETSGNMAHYDIRALGIAAAKGFLDHYAAEPVNYVNTPVILETRGISLQQHYSDRHIEYSHLITVTVTTEERAFKAAGKLVSESEARILRIDDYWTDVRPAGTMLAVHNLDRPGVIAFLATLLAEHNINIANMDVGRDRPGGTAVTMVNIDGEIPDPVLQKIRDFEPIINAKVIRV